MSLLSGSIQPPLLSLLSSTSAPSLSPLFRAVTDESKDSYIVSLSDSSPAQAPGSSRSVPHTQPKGCILHDVVHIQSSNPRQTYIQAGCSLSEYRKRLEKGKARDDGGLPLGIELPCMGLQVKRLGRRHMSFEVGIVDNRGREGSVRLSSFKKNPTVHPHRSPALIHLPLQLPQQTPSTLTPWVHIPVSLAPLIQLFHSLPRPQRHASDDGDDDDEDSRKRRKVAELPSGTFASVSYVRVYANCRVRRIWFSVDGERTIQGMGKGVRDEWELYAADEMA
ncbi:hypothetical protein I203_103424 [Kwoniella mangroviensis CBS 8507]|uniref:uncharacterized protein n=1 Tax=Kwoniella mangroviensis CBS 8507 TaxID=1296122 RepID=UPI00080CF5C7|nr:uncharacterized protein I203_06128 [Kwoniella mangroviensis CBS 8507]OCF64883.1 hypothetical protein I203_06128 [Kwoniella mangroviensis CBS 8507]